MPKIIGYFFFLRFYVFMRERQRHRQAPCREPDVGLDPGSPGSRPGLQAAPNRCATGAAQLLGSCHSSAALALFLDPSYHHWAYASLKAETFMHPGISSLCFKTPFLEGGMEDMTWVCYYCHFCPASVDMLWK